jgi:hypothetical protein
VLQPRKEQPEPHGKNRNEVDREHGATEPNVCRENLNTGVQ